jgi:hypothetical protein
MRYAKKAIEADRRLAFSTTHIQPCTTTTSGRPSDDLATVVHARHATLGVRVSELYRHKVQQHV